MAGIIDPNLSYANRGQTFQQPHGGPGSRAESGLLAECVGSLRLALV